MDLLKQILECKEEEIDKIIEEAINTANSNAEKVEKLGFLGNGNSNSVFKGFIPMKARIKYENLATEDYSMESTDYIYEFAHFVKKYNINSKVSLIHNLEYFINSYFGFPGKMDRKDVFEHIAWQTTNTDEDYFKALENNKLGDLKGKGAAQCTERSALAQQILSLFGFESYYCMGCVDRDNSQEGHCFNIVKRKNDYVLLDYSMPVTSYNEDDSVNAYYPFLGVLTNVEFMDFISDGTLKSFDEYYIKNKEKEKTGTQRMYIVGEYTINKKIENEKNL